MTVQNLRYFGAIAKNNKNIIYAQYGAKCDDAKCVMPTAKHDTGSVIVSECMNWRIKRI